MAEGRRRVRPRLSEEEMKPIVDGYRAGASIRDLAGTAWPFLQPDSECSDLQTTAVAQPRGQQPVSPSCQLTAL